MGLIRNYYSTLSKYRGMLLTHDIHIIINKLNREKLETEERWIIAAILFREYSKKYGLTLNRIAEYTGLGYRTGVKDISVIARELAALEGKTFNNMFEFSIRVIKGHNIRYCNLTLVMIHNGQFEKITDKVVVNIDYSKIITKEISRLIPDFSIKCDICNEEKHISQFKWAYTCCEACKLKHKTSKKAVLKNKVTYEMAVDSANEIKKDL